MNLAEPTKRIHPLVAVAAAAVTLFSLMGIAAISGLLPSSFGNARDATPNAMQAPALVAPDQRSADLAEKVAPVAKSPVAKPAAVAKPLRTTVASNSAVQAAPAVAKAPEPVPAAAPAPVVAAAPAQPAAPKAPQNNPIAIGVGAVVGGVLGNQVGSGDGKTLATILGAVGGGYIGNEISKKNQ